MNKRLLLLLGLITLFVPLQMTASDYVPVAILTTNDDDSTKTLTLTWNYDSLATATKDSVDGIYKLQGNTPWQESYGTDAKVAAITKVVIDPSFNNKELESCVGYFKGLVSVKTIEGISYLNTGKASYFDEMFMNCESLDTIDISHLDVAKARSMKSLFENCKSLKHFDFGFWSGHDDLYSISCMFRNCTSLEEIDISYLSGIDNISNLFQGCTSLKKVDISHYMCYLDEFSSILMQSLFDGCTSLTDVNMDYWVTNQYFKAEGIFKNCKSLRTFRIPDGAFQLCQSFNSMFEGCTSLDSVSNLYMGIANVKSIKNMFKGCTNLKKTCFDYCYTIHMEDMSGAFEGCTSLEEVDFGSQRTNLAQVTDMEDMFKDCTNLKKVRFNPWAKLYNLKNTERMFQGCKSLKSVDFYYPNEGKILKYTENMFNGCDSLTEIDLTNFDMSSVTNAYNMFSGCTKLSRINMGGNDLRNIDKNSYFGANYMFKGVGTSTWPCYLMLGKGFKKSELGEPDSTGLYKWYDGWFTLEPKLELPTTTIETLADNNVVMTFSFAEHDLATENRPDGTNGEFDLRNAKANGGSVNNGGQLTPRVVYALNAPSKSPAWKNISESITKVVFDKSFADARPATTSEWFRNMTNLKSVEGIENLNTSKTRSMQFMFGGCTSLKTLNISNFIVNQSTDIYQMLSGCTGLRNLYVGDNDFSGLNSTYGAFYGVGTPEKPCHLYTSEGFDNSVLGIKTDNYYNWLEGYFLDPVITGIEQIKVDGSIDADAPAYNLAGQRVGKNYKGAVIVNGRKLIRR